VIPLLDTGQKQEMRAILQGKLGSQYRADSRLATGEVEAHDPMETVMIGDRKGG